MPDQPSPLKRRKLASLQVLRAFAALAVVQAHTGISFGSWHTVGTFGVDIFFVLSAFIMAMICSQEGRLFFIKRLTRILPTYWVITCISCAGLVLFPHIDPTCPHDAGSLLKSLFFIPYAHTDGALLPVLAPGWTLNYEMCFYVLLTFALLLWRRRASWISILLLLLLMLVARFAPKSVFSSFYSNDIMLEFVAGILSFHIYSWAKPAVCKGMRPLFYLVSVISICGLVWYEGVRFYNPGGNRLWFGVIAYLLLQSVVLLSRSGWEINNPLLVLIGDSSYTLYLLHPLVISTMHHAIARAVPILQIQRPFGALAAVLVSVFCAVPVYVYIERPVHRRLNNLLPSAKCGHSGHLNLSMPLRSN